MSGPERIYVGVSYLGGLLVDSEGKKLSGVYAHIKYIRTDAVAEMIRQAVEAEREAMLEIVHPEFIWGALDNVHDCDTTMDDYADAVSRAQTAAIRARGGE